MHTKRVLDVACIPGMCGMHACTRDGMGVVEILHGGSSVVTVVCSATLLLFHCVA